MPQIDQKSDFWYFAFFTASNMLDEPPEHFQYYRHINDILTPISTWYYIVIAMGKSGKNEIFHNFELGGPTDTRPTHLNCILQDLFRDSPLDHIWRAKMPARNAVFGVFCRILAHILARI